MHIATAETLTSDCKTFKTLWPKFAERYIACFNDMTSRSPGPTTIASISKLRPDQPGGYILPFNPNGVGCGAAMRAACIGLRFPKPDQLLQLIAVGIESGRMTHNHPTGFLGSVVAALFTSYALQGIPIVAWGRKMLTTVPKLAMEYIEKTGRDVPEIKDNFSYFFKIWSGYLIKRKIAEDSQLIPEFPKNYDIEERDSFYTWLSIRGWGGSSGHDAPLIAYDALLSALYTDFTQRWNEVLKRGALHGGDSDSTGSIAGAWYGALFGFSNVNPLHFKDLEYRDRLENLGIRLLQISSQNYI